MGLYTWIFIICNVLISRTEVSVHAHHLNLNVAVLVERTPELEMPFIINRTIGIIELGKIKAQEITKNSTQMNFIVQPLDAPICVPQGFGALVAKLYHTTGIDAIIGPGKYNFNII